MTTLLAKAYQIRNKSTRPKIRDAAYAILHAASRNPELMDDPLPFDHFATLYAHFMPNPPSKPKTPLDWVIAAVAGEDEVRVYLRSLFAQNGWLYGTNGHGIRAVPTYLPDGQYYAQGGGDEPLADDDKMRMPRPSEMARILPRITTGKSLPQIDDMEILESDFKAINAIAVIEDKGFDLDLLRPVLAIADDWQYQLQGDTKILLESGDFRAAVMALNNWRK